MGEGGGGGCGRGGERCEGGGRCGGGLWGSLGREDLGGILLGNKLVKFMNNLFKIKNCCQ